MRQAGDAAARAHRIRWSRALLPGLLPRPGDSVCRLLCHCMSWEPWKCRPDTMVCSREEEGFLLETSCLMYAHSLHRLGPYLHTAGNAALHPHRIAALSEPGLMDMQVRMRVWERGSGGERSAAQLIDACSSTCAVEVGGGPWWDTWRTEVRSGARC